MFLVLSSSMNFAAASGETVFITGSGIATRLHEPVLKEFPEIIAKSVRISENPLPSDEKTDEISESWLFLGTPVCKHKDHIISSCKKYKKILCEKPVGLSKD